MLRVFALWIPLTALVTLITFQLLLPHQLDSQFNIVSFTSALIGIGAAALLAPKFSAVGMHGLRYLSGVHSARILHSTRAIRAESLRTATGCSICHHVIAVLWGSA